jgi:hypothetical protein
MRSPKITTDVAGIVFMLVLSIALCITFVVNPTDYGMSRLKIFIPTLTGLSIVVTFLFYYGAVELRQQEALLHIVQQTDRTYMRALSSVMEEMKVASKVIPGFVSSLLPEPSNQYVDKDGVEEAAHRGVLANKIFHLWQMMTIGGNFIHVDPKAFLSHCALYAKSPHLYQEWKLYRANYNPKTQQLGDLLFSRMKDRNGSIDDLHKQCASWLSTAY